MNECNSNNKILIYIFFYLIIYIITTTIQIGRNDATITYRFNGYSNTHEINVHKFMKEYAKYKANPYVEITKKEFPTLYTPLVLNPKKWLPELIRSKLLISNDIMNKELLN